MHLQSHRAMKESKIQTRGSHPHLCGNTKASGWIVLEVLIVGPNQARADNSKAFENGWFHNGRLPNRCKQGLGDAINHPP